MKPWRRIFLYVASAGVDLPVWLIALVMSLVLRTERRWVAHQNESPVLFVAIPEKIMGWRSGMTICHTIFYREDKMPAEGVWGSLQEHESVHVEQFEATMLRSAIVGVIAGVWGQSTALGLVLWVTGPLLMFLAAGVTAVLRGESFYRGAHHEEAAYSREVN